MPIFDTARLQPEGMGLERFPASLGERLGAEAEGAIEGLPIRELTDTAHLLGAKGVQAPIGNPMGDYTGPFDADEEARQNAAALPDVPIEEARAKVKAAGLDRHLALPDQPTIKSPALDIMIDRANARREREATVARGPQGFIPGALSFGTGFFLPLLDPLNDAAFMIPVVGEARGARMLAAAGDSLAGRAGVRFGIGAAQGAVGTAALQPLEAWARTQEGQDFTAAEALRNVMFGAGLAGTMHGGFGLVGDAWARAHGRAFEPATELGAPNREAPQHPPNEAGGPELASGISEPAEPMPAAIAQALPQAAHRDAMQGALASLIDGEPVQAAEHLDAAGRQDPRVADGLNALDKFAGTERAIRPLEADAPNSQAALADDWQSLAAVRDHGEAEAKATGPGSEELKEPDSIKAEAETEPENKILPPRSAEGGEGADRSAQAAETGGSKEQSSTEAGKVQPPAAVSPATKAAIDAEDRGRADFEARGGDDNWELKPGETLGDALAAIDRDTMELSEIVTRGAACLAAAVGA